MLGRRCRLSSLTAESNDELRLCSTGISTEPRDKRRSPGLWSPKLCDFMKWFSHSEKGLAHIGSGGMGEGCSLPDPGLGTSHIQTPIFTEKDGYFIKQGRQVADL